MAIEAETAPWFLLYGPLGSGLTTALNAFRELDFLTVAGIPPQEIEAFLAGMAASQKPMALVPAFNPYEIAPLDAKTLLEQLKARYPQFQFFYLSTPTEVLIQRYAAREKQHPYDKSGIRDAIEAEQLFYQTLKPLSDYHVDTSTTTAKELVLKVSRVLNRDVPVLPMSITLTSFGYKHGVPSDAELVFDMRFLPNPFYEETLRPYSGLDQAIRDYVFQFPEATAFLTHWQNLLAHSLPLYQQQGKTRLAIGIGCTGGQHRSVVMTLALAEFLQQTFPDFEVRVIHREQSRWPQQPCAAKS